MAKAGNKLVFNVPTASIKMIIADDHPLVLLALEKIAVVFPDVEIVGRAADSTELFAVLETRDCDVVMLDLNMPGGKYGDGLDVIIRLRSRYPNVALVILTMSSESEILQKAILLGVNAIISKCDHIELIYVAIVTSLTHEIYIGPNIRGILENERKLVKMENLCCRLSRRELEVLTLHASGYSVSEIAKKVSRSVKTISTQKCTAMKKLSLRSDADLYHFAIEYGISQEKPRIS